MKSRLPFPILHEDRDLIVIDKPAGLLTTHTRVAGRRERECQATAENFLTDYVRKGQARSRLRAWLVHRLDRDTSGVMVFAKSEAVADAMRERWNETTEKTYAALVEGDMESDSGVFESWLMEDADGYKVRSVGRAAQLVGRLAPKPPLAMGLGALRATRPTSGALRATRPTNGSWSAPKFSRTEWRVVSRRHGATLVEVKLRSGRKNQIRVHFSEAGHPVVGDEKYGGRRAARLCLHSASLALRHPATGEWMEFSSPPPAFTAPAAKRGAQAKKSGGSHGKR